MSYAYPENPPPEGRYKSQFEIHSHLAAAAGIPKEEFMTRSDQLRDLIYSTPAFSQHGPQELIYEIDSLRYDRILEEFYGPFSIPIPQGGFPPSWFARTFNTRRQMGGYHAGGQNFNTGYGSPGHPGHYQLSQTFGSGQQSYNQPPQSVGGSQQYMMSGGLIPLFMIPDGYLKEPIVSNSTGLGTGAPVVPNMCHTKNPTKDELKQIQEHEVKRLAAQLEKATALWQKTVEGDAAAAELEKQQAERAKVKSAADKKAAEALIKVPRPHQKGVLVTVAELQKIVRDDTFAEISVVEKKKLRKKAQAAQPGADMIDQAYLSGDDTAAGSTAVKSAEVEADATPSQEGAEDKTKTKT